MSSKRQPSKQRRQTQNQKQRAALTARRSNAAGSLAEGKVGRGGGATSAARTGSVLSRLRAAPSTGRAARTRSAGALPVGHRAALSSLLAAIAAALVGSFVFTVSVDRRGEAIVTNSALVAEWARSAADVAVENPEFTPAEVADGVDDWLPGGRKTYGQAFWPLSAGVLLPVVGAALAFRAVSKRTPAKLVSRAMYVTVFGTLLTRVPIIFFPTVIGLAVAAYQVRKAEVAAQRAAGQGDDVIEVNESLDLAAADDED